MIMKKNDYLSLIKSQNGYKRQCVSPIRYAGGKSLAVGYIVELLPEKIDRLISPFFGGGSFELAIAKNLGIEVKGYDIFDILVNYWQNQIANPKELYDNLSKLKPTQEVYTEIRKKIVNHWDCINGKSQTGKIEDSLDLAATYFFNFNLSYGPGFLGWASSIYLNEKKYQSMIDKVKEFNIKNISVECDTFENVFKKYPNDFFYCDPPYYLGEDSKMFTGIYPMRNIPIHHKGFKHEELRDLLFNHKGGWILSYNDCSLIREWYKDYTCSFPSWQYTMGQGETRIGKNRLEKYDANHIKKSHEILIYKPKE